ncbi:MAG: hypothetical protein LAT58_12450, partial [Opitutales bacterium]|nr:hypothetical protein [Opitutales bacterium]
GFSIAFMVRVSTYTRTRQVEESRQLVGALDAVITVLAAKVNLSLMTMDLGAERKKKANALTKPQRR